MKRIVIATICSMLTTGPAAAWYWGGYGYGYPYYNYGGYYVTPYYAVPPVVMVPAAPPQVIIRERVIVKPRTVYRNVYKPAPQQNTTVNVNVCGQNVNTTKTETCKPIK